MSECRRYKKICPFCRAECENFEGSNLFCNCNAKYYCFDKVWLDRNTGKRVWDKDEEDEGYTPSAARLAAKMDMWRIVAAEKQVLQKENEMLIAELTAKELSEEK